MKTFYALLLAALAPAAFAHSIACGYGNSGVSGASNPTLYASINWTDSERFFTFREQGEVHSPYAPNTGNVRDAPVYISGYVNRPLIYAFRNTFVATDYVIRFFSQAMIFIGFPPPVGRGMYVTGGIPELSCTGAGYVPKVFGARQLS